MLNGIIENIVSGLICAVLGFVCKKVWNSIKRSFVKSYEEQPRTKRTSKKTLRKQFFVCLILLVIFLSTATSIQASSIPLRFLKVGMFILAGYNFLFVWGAFDIAVVFYPDDDISNVPTQNEATQPKN